MLKGDRHNLEMTRHNTDRSQHSSLDQQDSFTYVPTSRKNKDKYANTRPSSKHRVLLPELVQITDILPELWAEDIIGRNCYFGRYGKIQSVILSKKESDPPLKRLTRFAFISYKSELDAAFAIAAMQNYQHESFKCIANYGATRYCGAFIKQIPCTYPNCYFLHEMREENLTLENIREMTKEEKINKAYKKIKDNLIYYIEKEHKEFLETRNRLWRSNASEIVNCQCKWQSKRKPIEMPTVKETMKWLIEEAIVDETEYQILKKSYKSKLNSAKITPCLMSPSKKQVVAKPLQIQKPTPPKVEKQSQLKILASKLNSGEQPYILLRYLNPQMVNKQMLNPEHQYLQEYYKKREFDLVLRRPKYGNTLHMYQTIMQPKKALNSYIHHKIIQQISHASMHAYSALPFAKTHFDPDHDRIKSAVYSSLIASS